MHDDVNQNENASACDAQNDFRGIVPKQKLTLQYSIFAHFAQHLRLTILAKKKSSQFQYQIFNLMHTCSKSRYFTPHSVCTPCNTEINKYVVPMPKLRLNIIQYYLYIIYYECIHIVHTWNAVASSSVSSTLGIFEWMLYPLVFWYWMKSIRSKKKKKQTVQTKTQHLMHTQTIRMFRGLKQ